MTTQIPDILVHRGRELTLCSTPLDAYLNRLRKSKRPNFFHVTTACWRGYVARWQLIDGGLYLMGLDGYVELADGKVAKADLTTALPWLKPPVQATWVTEELFCPEGRAIRPMWNRAHGGIYERDRLIGIVKGQIVGERVRLNPPGPIYFEVAEDGSRIADDDHLLADLIADANVPDDDIQGYCDWGQPADDRAPRGYCRAGESNRSLPEGRTEGG